MLHFLDAAMEQSYSGYFSSCVTGSDAIPIGITLIHQIIALPVALPYSPWPVAIHRVATIAWLAGMLFLITKRAGLYSSHRLTFVFSLVVVSCAPMAYVGYQHSLHLARPEK